MNKNIVFFSTSEDMFQLEDKSIKLMITSPPYWDLKNYEVDDQIGYKEDYQTYLFRLYRVWLETYRVLRDDGFAIININTKSYKKSLVLIPNDFIKQMKEVGFKFIDLHYWHKSSGIPRVNNLGDHFEYFLIFSKSSKPKMNNFNFFDYKHEQIIPRTNIWNINKKFGSVGKKFMVHPAIFPVSYIERMIEIFTKEHDLVLDPFLGSGTTLIASIRMKRYCIGYELNRDGYYPMINHRLDDFSIAKSYVEFT